VAPVTAGCATTEQVEHAQATADQALSAAQQAGQAASAAQGAADKAQADVNALGVRVDALERRHAEKG